MPSGVLASSVGQQSKCLPVGGLFECKPPGILGALGKFNKDGFVPLCCVVLCCVALRCATLCCIAVCCVAVCSFTRKHFENLLIGNFGGGSLKFHALKVTRHALGLRRLMIMPQ